MSPDTAGTWPGQVDVLIAGGGPSGLFLALDLAHRGIRSLIVEPRAEIDWIRPRAKTTNARTMTHLRRLGLADRLREAAPLAVAYSEDVIFCTSLVGHELTRFRHAFQLDTDRYEPQPECGQQVPQPVVEQVLRDAVEESTACDLRTGARFADAERTPEGHLVTVLDDAGVSRSVACRFLIGADGVSSAVRRHLGIVLEGSSASKANLGVLFRSRELGDVIRLDPAVQYWVVGRRYAGMVGSLDGGDLWWSIVQGFDAEAPHFARVPREDMLRELVGADVDIEVIAQDPWTARMLLAPSYGDRTTFLVGDAAHANPPWGGHGFNTCIGDAANLAWKLAAELHGWAGPGLAPSYEDERRPVAARTIAEAAANGSVLADDLMDDHLDADTERGRSARRRAGEALAVKRSEFDSLGLVLGYTYADSPLVTGDTGAPPVTHPIHYEPSFSPGCLLPHAWLPDTRSVYDLLGPDFTLLVDGDRPEVARQALARAPALALATGVPLVVRTVRGTGPDGSWNPQAPLVLVRPDQHVTWRGADLGDLSAALVRAVGGAQDPTPTTREGETRDCLVS